MVVRYILRSDYLNIPTKTLADKSSVTPRDIFCTTYSEHHLRPPEIRRETEGERTLPFFLHEGTLLILATQQAASSSPPPFLLIQHQFKGADGSAKRGEKEEEREGEGNTFMCKMCCSCHARHERERDLPKHLSSFIIP